MRALPAEYRLKLRRIDDVFNGTGAGEIGPCGARLDTMGDMLELMVGGCVWRGQHGPGEGDSCYG